MSFNLHKRSLKTKTNFSYFCVSEHVTITEIFSGFCLVPRVCWGTEKEDQLKTFKTSLWRPEKLAEGHIVFPLQLPSLLDFIAESWRFTFAVFSVNKIVNIQVKLRLMDRFHRHDGGLVICSNKNSPFKCPSRSSAICFRRICFLSLFSAEFRDAASPGRKQTLM